MQVLTFLARTQGQIVARHDLIESCWSGVAVSDDSINRVIAQLRRLAETLADHSFSIETITKVGYRLIVSSTGSAKGEVQQMAPPRAKRFSTAREWVRGDLRVVAGAVCAALALIGAVFWQEHRSNPKTEPATIELGPVTISGPGLSPEFGRSLRDEIASARGLKMRTALADAGNEAASPAWRFSGRVVSEMGVVRVYPQLLRPGENVDIWSPRIDVPLANANAAGIGQELREALQCIVSADNERGQQIISRAALAAYAEYCQENSKDTYDLQRQVNALRRAVQIEPTFARAWSDLGLFLAEASEQASSDQAGPLREEGLKAAQEAVRLSPNDGYGYSVMSRYAGPKEFILRERYLRAAVARPSDAYGGSTMHQSYAYFLAEVGRISESIAEHQRSLDADPNNSFDLIPIAFLEAFRGNYGRGQALIANQVALSRQKERPLRFRLSMALSARDWRTANETLAQLPLSSLTALQKRLVHALASGSQTSVDAALHPFREMDLIEGSAAAEAFAAANHPDEAIAEMDRLVSRFGSNSLYLAYQPSFSSARRTDAYYQFVRKRGLLNYWKYSRTKPDFCTAPKAPTFCNELS